MASVIYDRIKEQAMECEGKEAVMNKPSFISIVIPCRNEARYIDRFLQGLLAMDYPRDSWEILVADGRSNDGTRVLLEALVKSEPTVRWIDNPSLTVPGALNLAIAASKGQIIVRMDVHAEYPKDYLSSLVQAIDLHQADNVGVPWDTLPGGPGLQAHAVAASLRSPFGIGLASYRLGVDKPVEVDTVPFGCFRREVFEKIGLFDEELHRNQDDEFNARMKRNGMRIVLLPLPRIRYFARETIRKSARMMYQYGHFKPLVNRKIGVPATVRQFVPPSFVVALVATAALGLVARSAWWLGAAVLAIYAVAATAATIPFLFANDGFRRPAAILVPLAFFANHVAYGAGYLRGVWDFLILRRKPTVPSSSR